MLSINEKSSRVSRFEVPDDVVAAREERQYACKAIRNIRRSIATERLLIALETLFIFSGAVSCSSRNLTSSRPWIQLECYFASGSGNEAELSIEKEGTFIGHRDDRPAAVKGKISASDLSQLEQLFTDDLINIYMSNALPVNSSTDSEFPKYPVYRVVFRDDSERPLGSYGVFEAYLVDVDMRQETERMLSFLIVMLDTYVPR
jgi:hypothetical protein